MYVVCYPSIRVTETPFIQRHHKEDVIVGSTIGILSALICYSIFWPNPFAARTFGGQPYTQPRSLYVDLSETHGPVEFELAEQEDHTNAV